MSPKTALVMRATGSQGRGTVKHLVAAGWKVNCLVSDASTDRAVSLKAFGSNVTLYQGSWNDPASIQSAIKGCSALLLNQVPSTVDDAEVEEAKAVLKVAKEADVKHVVFPTTLPLSHPNVQEQMKDSAAAHASLHKAAVEELVKASGMSWTILRPGWFMTNYLPPLAFFMFPEIREAKLVNYVDPDCVFCLIDPEDTGAFAVAAFEDLENFSGQTINLVAEKMRVEDVAKVVADAIGQPLEAVYKVPTTAQKKGNGIIAGQLQNIGLHKFVDMKSISNWGIRLRSFDEFVKKHKDEFKYQLVPEKQPAKTKP